MSVFSERRGQEQLSFTLERRQKLFRGSVAKGADRFARRIPPKLPVWKKSSGGCRPGLDGGDTARGPAPSRGGSEPLPAAASRVAPRASGPGPVPNFSSGTCRRGLD